MQIDIDYRENDIINLFEKEQINFSELNFKTCNLIIGDFIIKKGGPSTYLIILKGSWFQICVKFDRICIWSWSEHSG